MSENLEKAVEILNNGGYTCVLCGNGKTCTSNERGVKPLLEWLDGDLDLKGFSAADKVVGKAAAFLYVLLGVSEVYSRVVSEGALSVFESNGIRCVYDTRVANIINRAGMGFCPMEEAVRGLTSPDKALAAIKSKLKQIIT